MMFVLEESQLLEDSIKEPKVLNLYKVLREQEDEVKRHEIIDKILCSESCLTLTKIILRFYRDNGNSICSPVSEDKKFTLEQRNEIYEALKLGQNDTAALALVIAASLTQLFVVDNFLGPTNSDILENSYKALPDLFKEIQNQVSYQSLTTDGSEVYHQVVNPWLLRTVQLYWILLNSLGCSRKLLELEFLVWKHRFLTLYHKILLEPTETLTNDLRKVQEFIFDHHIINDVKENNTQLVRFDIIKLCCELVQSAILRDNTASCRKFLDYACEVAGFSIEHTGILGKRTKFQHKDIPQLVVKVSGDSNSALVEPQDTDDEKDLPKDIILDDDTLLPDISFRKEDENGLSITIAENNLNSRAQLLLLTKLDFMLRTEVMEESLKDEWTLAYLRSITRSATIWSVKYKALNLRSTVERKHMRKMDRALLQMEELIKAGEKGVEIKSKRMRSFYSVLPLSLWQMQKSLGDISFDLGLFKNALDVYQKIEYYEGIISCYNALGQTVKAEKVILQELEKQETPYLYCLLGDATDKIEHYEKSWTLSKCRFSRAKKSIGTYYYVRKEYAKAIENYELALAVNPSNISILSLLAYSCLTVERYERAAECYRNITYQDDSNFLAWNNLSKAYIKLNQKERAWRTLREAIKCNYEEWKIWENFMIVSIEIGALDDVIAAYHRLVDIKSSHKDDQILSALTYSLLTKPAEEADSNYLELLNGALKLIARLISTSDCSTRLWICYFKLLLKEYQIFHLKSDGQSVTKLDIDSRISKITNALQRSTPTIVNTDKDWYKTPEKVNQVLDNYDELVDCYLSATDLLGQRKEVWRQWKYFKLSYNNVRKTLEKIGYMIN